MTASTENRIRHGGMLNLGNSGYMEVILQTLYHCLEFREMILSLNLSIEHEGDPSVLELVRELQIMFQEWHVLENVIPRAEDLQGLVQHDVLRLVYSHINPYIGPIGHVDPTCFVDAVKKCMKLRHPIDEPNDAYDFFTTFLRRLQIFFEDERMPTTTTATFQHIFVTPQSSAKVCFECNEVIPNSIVFLKGGVLAYCFECPVKDDQEYNHVTPILLHALRNGDGNHGVRLENHCDCSPHQTVAAKLCKRPIYQRMPTLLTVRIKRWPVANRNAYLEFDEVLDMSELLEQSDSSLVYRLLSVIVHHGNSNGYGRYFSFIRSDDQWAKFWGQEVVPVDWDTIQQESFGGHNGGQPSEEITNVGYMLIYERGSEMTMSQVDGTVRNRQS